jgi:hypothetical protein
MGVLLRHAFSRHLKNAFWCIVLLWPCTRITFSFNLCSSCLSVLVVCASLSLFASLFYSHSIHATPDSNRLTCTHAPTRASTNRQQTFACSWLLRGTLHIKRSVRTAAAAAGAARSRVQRRQIVYFCFTWTFSSLGKEHLMSRHVGKKEEFAVKVKTIWNQ